MDREQWLGELARFIVEGNTRGWAAGGSDASPIFHGMKSIHYRSADCLWDLRDNYSGYFMAPGSTIVSFKGNPVWSMAYFGQGQVAGREEIVKPTFEFLREALMNVTVEMPFRGPKKYNRGNGDGWEYRFTLEQGDVVDFLGRERITKDERLVFAQTVGGGIIIGKDKDRKPVYPWNL